MNYITWTIFVKLFEIFVQFCDFLVWEVDELCLPMLGKPPAVLKFWLKYFSIQWMQLLMWWQQVSWIFLQPAESATLTAEPVTLNGSVLLLTTNRWLAWKEIIIHSMIWSYDLLKLLIILWSSRGEGRQYFFIVTALLAGGMPLVTGGVPLVTPIGLTSPCTCTSAVVLNLGCS